MSTVGNEEMPTGGIPDLHGLVKAGRSDALAIRGPGDGGDAIMMTVIGIKSGSWRHGRSGGRSRESLRDSTG
jgi:hypothetical protein